MPGQPLAGSCTATFCELVQRVEPRVHNASICTELSHGHDDGRDDVSFCYARGVAVVQRGGCGQQRVQAVVASSSSDEKALLVSQVQLESVERTIKTLLGRCVL